MCGYLYLYIYIYEVYCTIIKAIIIITIIIIEQRPIGIEEKQTYEKCMKKRKITSRQLEFTNYFFIKRFTLY